MIQTHSSMHLPNFPKNKILVGDAVSTLADFPAESIDMCLFSPPYDWIRDYNNDWHFDYEAIGSQLFRVLKEGSVCVVVIGDGTKNFAKSLTTFRLAVSWVDKIGWRLFECCIYKRHGRSGAWWKNRFRVDHEYILIFFKGQKPKYFSKDHMLIKSKYAGKIYSGTERLTNGELRKIQPKFINEMKCPGTVLEYATSSSELNKVKLIHPATFPDKLAVDMILAFSQEGDIVLDPMCGSGTTCVAAANLKRDFVGIDINPEYVSLSYKRLLNEVNYKNICENITEISDV